LFRLWLSQPHVAVVNDVSLEGSCSAILDLQRRVQQAQDAQGSSQEVEASFERIVQAGSSWKATSKLWLRAVPDQQIVADGLLQSHSD